MNLLALGLLPPLSSFLLVVANPDDLRAAAPPNLNLNTEEKRVYGQLFRQADTESVGVVTGDVAVKFFDKTRLDSRVLGEVLAPVCSYFSAIRNIRLTKGGRSGKLPTAKTEGF